MTGPTLTTERLILRPPAAEDFPGFVALMGSDYARFIGGPLGPEAVWRNLAMVTGAWLTEGFSFFSVIERDTCRWLGRVGPWRPLGWPGNEVAWGILQSEAGHGYATEAAAACMNFAFDVLGWDDAIHTIAPDNAPSQAVARKLGSVNRGPGRLPPPLEAWPIEVWGQTRTQWRAR